MRLAILFSALVLVAASVPAEDLILIDGRYLHVKILNATERGLDVQLLDGGGQIFISWGLIVEPMRTELRVRYHLQEDESQKTIVEDGHRITTKKGDTWEGLIVNETAENVTLKHQGTTLMIPKAAIKEIEKLQVNVLEIYTPEEYYTKRAAEVKAADDDIPANMELGELANNLGLYEKAFAHFKKIQAADPGYETNMISNMLKRLEELSKNKQIRDVLDEAKKLTFLHQFPKAITNLDAVIAMKDVPASIKAEAELLKQKTIKARYEYYRVLVREAFESTLRNKIRTWSRDEKMKLDEARRKLRADLYKEVVLEVAERLKLDPKADVEKMWEDRRLNQPRTAMYGSGSFIVLGKAPDAEKYDAELQKYLQNALRNQQKSNNNQNATLSAQPDKLPKPPTKEDWWSKVSTSAEREQWMLAFWAENAKKVQVVGDRWEDCSRCGGRGWLEFSGSQGDNLRTTCPSCQGHKKYKGVAFK